MGIYRRGESEPVATCFDHAYGDITWGRRYHENPAFSRDSRRLYFWEAVSEQKVEARYADLSPLLA